MPESKPPNLFDIVEEHIPFHKWLGIKVDHADKGYVRFLIPFKKEFIGNFVSNFYHGGVLSAAMDAVAGTTAGAHVYPEVSMNNLSTIDIRVDYMKPVLGQAILVHGQVSSVGQRSIFVRMWITYTDAEEILVEGRSVFNIRK